MREGTTQRFVSETTLPGRPLVEIDSAQGRLGAQVERGLRDAVRGGRLGPGARLPSTRSLAADLGVSRRIAVEAYEQLVAEGWLVSRHGAGTYVAGDGAAPSRTAMSAATPAAVPGAGAQARAGRLPYDFFPGVPDLASFPRAAWVRAMREALRTVPDLALHYPDPAGAPELRAVLSARLARVRGLVSTPEGMVITTGARQGLALMGRALAARGARRIAVEWPTIPAHADAVAAGGLEVARVPVRSSGIDLRLLAASGADAVLVTPAHQMPLGVALAPEARAALVEWARDGDRIVIEDDYDAEFRYDRKPLGALQALAPEAVAYLGSASKTLAPAARIGWLALPPALVPLVRREKELDDAGSPVLDQLALAQMIESGAFDRHLRAARRRYGARRDALAAALAAEIPQLRLQGMAAGLHVVVRLPQRVDAAALEAAALERGTGVYPLPREDGSADAVVLGYANLSEPAIAEGVRRFAAALGSLHG
jgi:GntR family transcriptional regulator/MocR family aminotransferase